jgi:hypothetical protein
MPADRDDPGEPVGQTEVAKHPFRQVDLFRRWDRAGSRVMQLRSQFDVGPLR